MKPTTRFNTLVLATFCSAALLTACDNDSEIDPGSHNPSTNAAQEQSSGSMNTDRQSDAGRENMPGERSKRMDAMAAIATLSSTEGNNATGKVTIMGKSGGGLRMDVNIKGLTPGKHGFHIHQKGDCSAPDGTSAGGHFNPADTRHGAPDDAEHHAGDLGNIRANEQGVVWTTLTSDTLQFKGEEGVIGRAFIVHQGADDLESQPSGAAGPRVACGVIEAAGGDTRG